MYDVIISIDQPEAEAFQAYLQARGHEATIGRTTDSYIDGVSTSVDQEARDTMRALWEGYCNS